MTQTARKPIRLGMVGGGKDAFIGEVHRFASRLDGAYELVAGALSSTPEKAKASGEALGLDSDRIYGDFEQMAEQEALRPDGIEAVAIVTPNHMHFAPAKLFLKHGIHVICDKPSPQIWPTPKRFLRWPINQMLFLSSPIIIPAIPWRGRHAKWWPMVNWAKFG